MKRSNQRPGILSANTYLKCDGTLPAFWQMQSDPCVSSNVFPFSFAPFWWNWLKTELHMAHWQQAFAKIYLKGMVWEYMCETKVWALNHFGWGQTKWWPLLFYRPKLGTWHCLKRMDWKEGRTEHPRWKCLVRLWLRQHSMELSGSHSAVAHKQHLHPVLLFS